MAQNVVDIGNKLIYNVKTADIDVRYRRGRDDIWKLYGSSDGEEYSGGDEKHE